jgi:hypothetical protein
MENKERKARITNWESNGAFIMVSYIQENGERVEASFKRVGWKRPPQSLLNDFYDAMRHGPTTFVGRRG